MLTSVPAFSVIVAVYNDWVLLDRCLQSLAEGTNAPGLEVIVADDGSTEPAPGMIHRWSACFPLTVVRQPHEGIAAARNRGIRNSRGSVMLFIDADCIVQSDCLSRLAATILEHPQHACFQLHITGDSSGLVGRSEELRLETLQNHLRQPDGRIRYLNTAGFAIRREGVDIERGLFDPDVLRAEDTLLLANLITDGTLPLFVESATVRHAISLSLPALLKKDMRSAYLEGETFDRIASMGVKIRTSHRERLGMFAKMWKMSGGRSIGRLAWFVALTRTALARSVSGVCSCFRLWPSQQGPMRSYL